MAKFPHFHAGTDTPPVGCSRSLPATLATPASTATTTTPKVAGVAGSSRVHPELEVIERRILTRAEVMALPIMPCTTCLKFKWGRRPSCEMYQSLAEPKKGCRCAHYEGRS